MKLERLDEPWIRTDADFINDDKFLAIDMHNALELRGKAYLVLLACAGWARTHPKSANWVPRGVFDDIVARLWPTLRPQQVVDALSSSHVRAIRVASQSHAFAIKLLHQDKWQLSAELSMRRSEAGRRGAISRWQRDSNSMASAMSPADDSNQMALAMEIKKENGEVEIEEGIGLSTDVDFTNPIAMVFDVWKRSTGKNGRTVLDVKRRTVIAKALGSYPLADVLDAVQGWAQIPHNRGENDRHRPFNDIELLLRDAKRIETFRDAQRGLVVTSGKVHPLDRWASDVLKGGADGSQELR